MEFLELASKRRTVRHFKPESIPPEIIKQIVQAGLMAPSPNNSRPWQIMAITNQNLMVAMCEAVEKKLASLFPSVSKQNEECFQKVKTFSTIFVNAPLVLAVMMKPYKAVIDDLLNDSNLTHEQINALRKYPDIQATGALVQNMLLAATELGYAGVWVSGALVASEELDEILNGGEYKLQTLVALGRPVATPEPHKKLNLKKYLITID